MKSFLGLAYVLFASLALPLAAQTPTDPVAWLKAEGNAQDATGNGNQGVVNGSVPYVAGKVGNAFSFNANVANYVRIPNSASLQTAQMSVEYWVNFNSATNAVTVAKRNGSSDAWQVGITYSGGNFNLQFVGEGVDRYSASLASPVGVWTHVAATYDGSTAKGYINGAQVLSEPFTLHLGSRTADIYVGNYAGSALPFDGKVDELSIYNRALSAAEVLAIYQAGSSGKTPPVPTVTGVSPSSGSTLGGTSVTITGTNFTGATAVTFGGNPASGVVVVNDTTIMAVTPAGAAGTSEVTVFNPTVGDAVFLFTYVTPNVPPSFNLPESWAAWIPRDSNRTWKTLASSADGTKLAAVVQGGQIFTSADSGVTWTARENNRNWGSIASSADGTRLAAVELGGRIYTSTDSGVTWTARASNASWSSIASSADGLKLAAVAVFGQISTSTDGGITWTASENSRLWNGITSSADGMKLAAEVSGGQIYTSTDGGATWTARESARNWGGITSSSDGSKLAAIVQNGQIHTSSDGGVTWTPRDSSRNWWSITSSADGGKLAAVVKNGQIYTSIDSGVTWIARENTRTWQTIATSADGSKLVAAVAGGQIYTSSRLPYQVTVLANSGPSTTGSFASSISPGPVAETSQTVTFQVTTNNNALFTVQPTISSNGTLTFTPGSSGGTASITVVAIDNGGIAYGGVNTSTPQTFTITVLAPIEAWRQAQFGNATAGIGDNDDFDGDGLLNLLEYGLVLSPIGQSASPAAEFVSYAEGDRLRLILQRDPARSDLTIEVQAVGDLTGTWTTLATSTNGAPFTGPGYVGGDSATAGVKTVEIRDIVNIADASSRFLRVKVSR